MTPDFGRLLPALTESSQEVARGIKRIETEDSVEFEDPITRRRFRFKQDLADPNYMAWDITLYSPCPKSESDDPTLREIWIMNASMVTMAEKEGDRSKFELLLVATPKPHPDLLPYAWQEYGALGVRYEGDGIRHILGHYGRIPSPKDVKDILLKKQAFSIDQLPSTINQQATMRRFLEQASKLDFGQPILIK